MQPSEVGAPYNLKSGLLDTIWQRLQTYLPCTDSILWQLLYPGWSYGSCTIPCSVCMAHHHHHHCYCYCCCCCCCSLMLVKASGTTSSTSTQSCWRLTKAGCSFSAQLEPYGCWLNLDHFHHGWIGRSNQEGGTWDWSQMASIQQGGVWKVAAHWVFSLVKNVCQKSHHVLCSACACAGAWNLFVEFREDEVM